MGRPRGGKVSSSSDSTKAPVRSSTRERKELIHSYQEEDSHSEVSEHEEKEDSEVVSDFAESLSESVSEGDSSGSEYGVKRKKIAKVSPKKGKAAARGKGRGRKSSTVSPKGKGKAAAKSSPKGKGRPGRKPKATASTPPPKTRPSRGQANKRMKYRERSDSEDEESPVLSESEPEEEIESESEPEEIESASEGEKRGKKRKAPAPSPKSKSAASKAKASPTKNGKSKKNLSEEEEEDEEEEESDLDEKNDKSDEEVDGKAKSKTKNEKKSETNNKKEEKKEEKETGDAEKDDKNDKDVKNDVKPATENNKDEDVEMKDVEKNEVADTNNKAEDKNEKSEVKDTKATDGEGEKAGLKNPTETDFQSLSFGCDKKTASGETWNFKVSCWNIGGLKSWVKKNGLKYLKKENPDVMCLQEVRSSEKTQPPEVKTIENYPHSYWSFAEQSGHHGVGLLSKTKPINVQVGFPLKDSDSEEDKKFKESVNKEGRLIVAEYEKIYLVNAYVPNSGRPIKELGTKPYPPKILNGERLHWDRLFREYILDLETKKPVIVAGDLNVAHDEIDLANPKTNTSTAGFTKEERESFSKLLEETKLVDSFRALYPDEKGAYTFWSYMNNARANNVGWRLDYFLISEKLKDSLVENKIRPRVLGSDHCPLVLMIHL